jgi:hypothetical protein
MVKERSEGGLGRQTSLGKSPSSLHLKLIAVLCSTYGGMIRCNRSVVAVMAQGIRHAVAQATGAPGLMGL